MHGLDQTTKDRMTQLLLVQTRKQSRVLYGLNKHDLKEFVQDPANNFLVTFFAQNETFEDETFSCKAEALDILLYFGYLNV